MTRDAAARSVLRPATVAAAFLGLLPLTPAGAAPSRPDPQQHEITIPTSLGDTTETFWLQIPSGYDAGAEHPLLVGWHQLGGDHLEISQATDIDSIADARGWILACPRGPTTTHWNNQAAQSHVVDVIAWISDRWTIDADRIYMIGSSMGGAAGMVFSNNHLDPAGPMVAAAVSISGIQDCERRFREQGWNYSMVDAFGGTPEQVPFTYHRNSAIFFADSTESMHGNARHLPLLLSFGRGQSDLVWRQHAEDLYARMAGIADTVVLHESALSGHGWSGAEISLLCDFLSGFELERWPPAFTVTADEEGRWYWADLRFREPSGRFARFDAAADPGAARVEVTMSANVRAAVLDLAPLGFPLAGPRIACRVTVSDAGAVSLVLRDVASAPSAIYRDGFPYDAWSYDLAARELSIESEGETSASYSILFETASASGEAATNEAASPIRIWIPHSSEVAFRLARPGRLTLERIDVGGRRLASLDLGQRPAGEGRTALPGRRHTAGVSWLIAHLSGGAGRPARAVLKHIVAGGP